MMKLFVGDELLGPGEAIFVDAHHEHLLRGDVGVGEIDMLGALFGDGDAVGADVKGVEAAFAAHDGDHGVPTGFDKFRRAVDALADFVEDIVVIADCLHRFRCR